MSIGKKIATRRKELGLTQEMLAEKLSLSAQAFSDEKLNEYIEETETYVLPLLKTVKQNYMEYNNAVFLIKYHMLSVLESLKNMMMRDR